MTEVLIVGAGPTGLTLAGELAVRGVDVRIVDRAECFFGGSRADGIQPRTMEVFADIGIIDAVSAAGSLGVGTRAYRGNVLLWEGRATEVVEPSAAVPYPNIWFLPQFRTEEFLRRRLADLGITVELGTRLTELTQDEDGVTATLATAHTEETVRVRYLVGADGGSSTVRKQLGIAFPGGTDETTTIFLADARIEGIGRDHALVWSGQTSFVSVEPLAGTDMFVVAVPPPDDPATQVEQYLQQQITEVSGRDDIAIEEVTWHTTWRANTRLAERFRSGRVFLAGDAAHVHPPTGGQGMNTGIQDGYNLGWKLAAALDGASDVVLDSYEPERMMAARRALELSTELLDKHQRGDDDAHLRGSHLHGLTLEYRDSPISRDQRAHTGGVAAGDRAPDAPVTTADGRPIRLFELFRGPHWTLLVFGAPDAEVLDALREQLGPSVWVHPVVAPEGPVWSAAVVDSGWHARHGYDVLCDNMVLVRPDGYIGLIAGIDEPARVREYWSWLQGATAITHHISGS